MCNLLVTLWANFKDGSPWDPKSYLGGKAPTFDLTKPFKYGYLLVKSDLDYFMQKYCRICVEVECDKHQKIFREILFVPHNIVMDLNNVMVTVLKGQLPNVNPRQDYCSNSTKIIAKFTCLQIRKSRTHL